MNLGTEIGTLFYAATLVDREIEQLAYVSVIDPLGPFTRVDLADGEPQDWELGVAFLPGMDEVRVTTARLDLRGVRAPVPAEGWSAVARAKGFRITLAQPARLVAIAFDPVAPRPDGKTLRLLVSPADPAGPPAFIDPPFPLGAAYAAIPSWIGQRSEGGRLVADLDPTFGTSWLVQWATGDDATQLTPVDVTTAIRSVTIERAVADARLELRPDDTGGDPVLVWNHPGVLDPATGLQPVDMSPIARKRLADRLAAANAAPAPPPTLTLPVRLTARAGGPVGVSGTELLVDYAADALGGAPVALGLRGEPQPLSLSVPAGLRPAGGRVAITAHHLGRELNGPVGAIASVGGPGRLVTVGRWAAVARPVVAAPADPAGATVTLVAVTVDVASDAAAELAVDLRADIHGLPGAVLTSAVARLDGGPRAVIELVLDRPADVPVGSVVWIAIRATTGAIRWYDDPADRAPALPPAPTPAVRVSSDQGATWAPDEAPLAGPSVPRARLLHRVTAPFTAPVLTIVNATSTTIAALALSAGGAADEFAFADGPVPPGLADLAGRTIGTTRGDLPLHVATTAALDLRVTAFELVYPPNAGPTSLPTTPPAGS